MIDKKFVAFPILVEIRKSLMSAFSWSETPEGHDYWQRVYFKLLDMEKHVANHEQN